MNTDAIVQNLLWILPVTLLLIAIIQFLYWFFLNNSVPSDTKHKPSKVTSPIMPTYPVLAGQHASYLEHSLHGYKNGQRKNGIMAGIVAGLSDADMQALALYFAAQEGPLYVPSLP